MALKVTCDRCGAPLRSTAYRVKFEAVPIDSKKGFGQLFPISTSIFNADTAIDNDRDYCADCINTIRKVANTIEKLE